MNENASICLRIIIIYPHDLQLQQDLYLIYYYSNTVQENSHSKSLLFVSYKKKTEKGKIETEFTSGWCDSFIILEDVPQPKMNLTGTKRWKAVSYRQT